MIPEYQGLAFVSVLVRGQEIVGRVCLVSAFQSTSTGAEDSCRIRDVLTVCEKFQDTYICIT